MQNISSLRLQLCQNPYLKQAVVVTGRVDWGHRHPSAMTLVIASCCGCWKRAVELQFNNMSTCIFHCIDRTRFTLSLTCCSNSSCKQMTVLWSLSLEIRDSLDIFLQYDDMSHYSPIKAFNSIRLLLWLMPSSMLNTKVHHRVTPGGVINSANTGGCWAWKLTLKWEESK